jgi:RNA-directed DNA polymerase
MARILKAKHARGGPPLSTPSRREADRLRAGTPRATETRPKLGAEPFEHVARVEGKSAKYPRPTKIAALERLRAAWLDSKDASGRGRSAGIDRMTPEQFRSRLDENLHSVQRRLLSANFRFAALRPVLIPKSGGKFRVICVPTVADRLIQRLLLNYVVTGDKLKVKNPVSYGFRKGYGVQKALVTAKRIRSGHKWVLKSDIQSFFDEIERDVLKAEVQKYLRKSSATPLIFSAIDCELDTTDHTERSEIAKAGIRVGRGLRQGMPLSPILSNLVLREFDNTLHKRRVRMVRYADDFAIFCDSEAECQEAMKLVRELLARRKHYIPDVGPESKTRIYEPHEAVEFLGLSLEPREVGSSKYQIAVPREAFDQVKIRFEQFSNFEEAQRKWRKLSRTISTMSATANGFLNVYTIGKNFSDFRSHVENCRRDALRNLLSTVFGVDVLSNLDDRRRDFLDLLQFSEQNEERPN